MVCIYVAYKVDASCWRMDDNFSRGDNFPTTNMTHTVYDYM